MSELTKAYIIAEKEFAHKKDKGNHPYLDHLWRVKEGVENMGYYGQYEIVALLHDLLEDCEGWTEERLLKEGFSKETVDAVVCMTRNMGETYNAYIRKVMSNEIASVVKLADLEDNMDITRLNKLTEEDFKRLQKYHKTHKKIKKHLDN